MLNVPAILSEAADALAATASFSDGSTNSAKFCTNLSGNCQANSLTCSAFVTGGTPPYTFVWSDALSTTTGFTVPAVNGSVSIPVASVTPFVVGDPLVIDSCSYFITAIW